MPEAIAISPVSRPVGGTIRPPGSKSLTNRALIVASLAEGRSRLTGVLDSDDTRVMLESLKRLGLRLEHNAAAATIEIDGCRGTPPIAKADLWLGKHGPSIRFLKAVCCLGRGVLRPGGD